MIVEYIIAKECKNEEVWCTCYKCTDAVDLTLHKPNSETEFVYFEMEGKQDD